MSAILRRLVAARTGSVMLIFALLAPAMAFLIGMTVDYTMAASRHDQLDAVADAAALAALTPQMLAQSDSASVTAAQDTFNSQISGVSGVSYSTSNLNVAVTDTANSSGTATIRTVKVSYTAGSDNTFAKLLGMATIPLGGSSTATASSAPNINFYLLLDSSPSMAIPDTTTGITTLQNNTSQQGGCSFACHESNPSSSDNAGNPAVCSGGSSPPTTTTTTKHGTTTTTTTCKTGTLVSSPDNYTYAETSTAGGGLGLTLRIDMERSATEQLMTTAQSDENSNDAIYQMAIYTFDVNFNPIQTLTSNLGTAQTEASNISMLEVYSNNYLTASNYNNDVDTNYDNALANINSIMPNPGRGTNASGDTPQEVLFFVTDGVEDEYVPGVDNGDTDREESVLQGDIASDQSPTNPLPNPVTCTSIKNRGIRIAVVYLPYYPLTGESWYTDYIAPFESNISPTLEACASPDMFITATTDTDLPTAMATLFQYAVQTARLTK